MYLKTLTLRGFKSFASATTLRFEPGITCVVGPNGSGKSNVVDALSWVMGEQGAKSLRGGKMEDVIFAGTSGRPPLGRAEVVLTIDNTDGALPIDYAEVTISRTMFRNGGSEYAINGEPCRLLDVQELLSDSGIGREMHVIVGQGQLDSVLSATPEDRRGFIEEAAGVLKHRKRKEKALRKLDAMEANLVRLTDLTAELRRQLKPLGRQAEVAKRASGDPGRRARRPAAAARRRPVRVPAGARAGGRRRERPAEAARRGRGTRWPLSQQREIELEAAVAATLPALTDAQETWFRLSGLRDRFRGLASLASERVRFAADVPTHRASGREPEDMEREARRDPRAGGRARAARSPSDRITLAGAEQRRLEAEARPGAEEAQIAAQLRAIADRREGMARLAGKVAAAAHHRRGRRGRARAARRDAGRRPQERAPRGAARSSPAWSPDRRARRGRGRPRQRVRGRIADAGRRRRSGLRRCARRSAPPSRSGSLSSPASRRWRWAWTARTASAALLAATGTVSGLLGSVAAILTIEPGAEAAVAAALGAAADAVAVDSIDSAVDALDLLKRDDAGRAGILVGGGRAVRLDRLADTAGLRHVRRRPRRRRPSRCVRRSVGCWSGWPSSTGSTDARALVAAEPSVTAATRDGDVLGAAFAARRLVTRAEPAGGAGRRRRGEGAARRARRTGASGCGSR